MKKAIVILLLVLYSASTIGATINMHYCMNKFASISLSTDKKDKCPKCGMRNTGCCKDEKKQIKLSLDQQKAEYNQSVNNQAVVLTITNSICFKNHFVAIEKNKQAYLHAPPLILNNNPQAFFSTFLI